MTGKENGSRNKDGGEKGQLWGVALATGAFRRAMTLRGAKRSNSAATVATASTSHSGDTAAAVLGNTNLRHARGKHNNPTHADGWDVARSSSVPPPTSEPAREEAIAASPKTRGAKELGMEEHEPDGDGIDDKRAMQERHRSKSESASMRQQVERMRQRAELYTSNYMLKLGRSESSQERYFESEAAYKRSAKRVEEEKEGFARHSAATSRRCKDHWDSAPRPEGRAASRLASAPPPASKPPRPKTKKEERRRGAVTVRHMEYTDARGLRGHYSGEVNGDFFPHGNGTMTYDNGVRTEGIWKKGEWRRPPKRGEGLRRGNDERGGGGGRPRRSKSETAMMMQQVQLMRQQAELYISNCVAKPDRSTSPWHGHSGLEAVHERSRAREEDGEEGFARRSASALRRSGRWVASGSEGDGAHNWKTHSTSSLVKFGNNGKVLTSCGREVSRSSFSGDVVPTATNAASGSASLLR